MAPFRTYKWQTRVISQFHLQIRTYYTYLTNLQQPV